MRPKKGKRRGNPVVTMRESDRRNLQREAVDQSYRMFMAVALTTVLDKHDAADWLMDYVHEMNSLIDEIVHDRVTVDELAAVLDEEYGIQIDYKAIG